jgi:DNA-binding transcriptional LysR family regulator
MSSNKLREIECFISVAASGSFVRAADAIGVSKTAVSRSVIELEQRLGARLFQRSTRRVSLTPAGTLYLARCQHIVQALDEADALVGSDALEATGLLRVQAPMSFGTRHLAPLWPQLLARHPGLRLDVHLSDALLDLGGERFDLAVRISDRPHPSLMSRPLGRTRLVACAAPSYLVQHGEPMHPGELADHAVIGYSYAADGDAWHFDSDDGPIAVRTQARLCANNGDTCLAAARAGLGIVMQPSFLLADSLRSGELVPVLQRYPLRSVGIHAVYPSRRQLPMKVRVAIDFLAESLAGADWLER